MAAIEFDAKVDNGSIPVPEQYRDRLIGMVRVRVVHQEEPLDGNMIKDLLETPLEVANFDL